ncbi:MAG TPA: NAD(P)-dependent oxidoreductase [Chitinophagaceae bacterium]|nr:NAD(P)-dependent oxidoreductase [Chitinophagaceae bacterium]
MKAFLGMGLLGSNFVKAMRRKGEDVQIWNRTTEKARALEAGGAKAFDQVEAAVKGADTIHITLKDDASVDEVLSKAIAGFQPGATIIDHTTTSVKGAIRRTNDWKTKGFTYLHAPVFMGPSNALESTGVMLVSGDQTVIGRCEPELSKMTGKLMNLGTKEGKAAGIKLIGNLFLLSLTAGLSDSLSLAKAYDIPVEDIESLFHSWNPGASVSGRLQKITDGNYDQPSWELKMARKDAGLMMAGAKDGGTQLTLIPAIASEMDRWIEKGHGDDDWTVIAKNSLP